MGLLQTTLDAFEDPSVKDDSLIKSGTLRTTRATALIAVSVVATMALFNEFAPSAFGLDDVSAPQKFAGAIAVGFIWAIGSAADALARGIATIGDGSRSTTVAAAYAVALEEITQKQELAHGLRVLQPPLHAKLIDKPAAEEVGWLAVATAIRPGGIEICFVKGDEVDWRSARDRGIKWSVSA